MSACCVRCKNVDNSIAPVHCLVYNVHPACNLAENPRDECLSGERICHCTKYVEKESYIISEETI